MQHICVLASIQWFWEEVGKWSLVGIKVLSMRDNAWMNARDGACFPLLPAMALCFANLYISWLAGNTCGTLKSWANCAGQHLWCCRDEVQSPSILEKNNCESNMQQIIGIFFVCLFIIYVTDGIHCYSEILKDLN